VEDLTGLGPVVFTFTLEGFPRKNFGVLHNLFLGVLINPAFDDGVLHALVVRDYKGFVANLHSGYLQVKWG
jgi:hypothetical protein